MRTPEKKVNYTNPKPEGIQIFQIEQMTYLDLWVNVKLKECLQKKEEKAKRKKVI